MQLSVGPWVITADPVKTRAAYAGLAPETGAVGGCDCDYCRNFAAASGQSFVPYPAFFLDTLQSLGIPSQGEMDVTHICETAPGSGVHLYDGCFHFIGRIDTAPAERPENVDPNQFSFWFGPPDWPRFPPYTTDQLDFSRLEPYSDYAARIVQLGFLVHVPWVLRETL